MKSRTKNLGLAGLILGSSVFSGCAVNDSSLLGMGLSALGVHKGNPVAQAVGSQLANYGASQAGANSTNVYVNDENAMVPMVESFVCNYMRDFNGDGVVCPVTESVGRGKVIFEADETITYAVNQNGCKGRTLRLYNQKTPDSPLEIAMVMQIQKDNSVPQTFAIPLNDKAPGVYRVYWTLDGAKVGEHLIEVKPKRN